MNTVSRRISINMKTLCQLLGVEEQAPVFYIPPGYNKQYLIYSRCVSEELALAVEHNNYDDSKEYDRSDCGLYIPDISIDEFMAIQRKGNPDSINDIMGTIPGKIRLEEYKLTYALFCILHELGHWNYYKDSGMTDYEFYLHDRAGRKEAVDLSVRILKMPNDDPDKSKLVTKQNIMYRNVPSEKAADQFALKHLEEAMALVRNSL